MTLNKCSIILSLIGVGVGVRTLRCPAAKRMEVFEKKKVSGW